jgi:hypothetical protein
MQRRLSVRTTPNYDDEPILLLQAPASHEPKSLEFPNRVILSLSGRHRSVSELVLRMKSKQGSTPKNIPERELFLQVTEQSQRGSIKQERIKGFRKSKSLERPSTNWFTTE